MPWPGIGAMRVASSAWCIEDGRACARRCRRNAVPGLTTPGQPPGSLMPMNDIASPPLSTTSATSSTSLSRLTARSLPRRVADLSGTASDEGVRLTWRRLDRLTSAATLGVILASPRTALLTARELGPRIPPLAPTGPHTGAETRRPDGLR
jgi:hypothetical protein